MSCQVEVNARPGTARPRRSLLGRLGLGFGLAGGLAVGALFVGFLLFLGMLEETETAPPRHAEGVVALTGGADRIADAVALLAKGGADRLLISGVNPATSGIAIARLAPDARRLLQCCIELGYAAENTVGNAEETSRWVRQHKIRSLIVVTSNYHMPRALAEIAHAAPGVELLAFPVVTERSKAGGLLADGQRARLVLSEYLKYVIVLARLHLLPDRTGPSITA